MALTGRQVIRTDVFNLTRANVLEQLQLAMSIHYINSTDIEYLWRYFKGDQPILQRIKQVRPEICNKIVENRANEIVSFKVGYLCGEPIQYVSRKSYEGVTEAVERLNDFMFAEGKSVKDQELVEWQMICGTAYRLVLPQIKGDKEANPFRLYTLDPRNTFVVYSSEIEGEPIFAVKYFTDNEGVTHYSVYTKDRYFLVENDTVVDEKPLSAGIVPIFEYPANSARLGAFEIVLPLLDALNDIQSNRLDGVEQTVQSFLKFINCDIDEEKYAALRAEGALLIKSVDGQKADVDVVKNDLDQTQTQTLKDDIYSAIVLICGMPNRNGGSSTSDTGAAVQLRDGWSDAEARAKRSEGMFKMAEQKMLRLVLKYCREFEDLEIRISDMDMKFTRRNYEAIQSKAQVLCEMLAQPKINPLLAFEHCGMFSDPQSAYNMSKPYIDKILAKEEPAEPMSGGGNNAGNLQ